ncbi:MAG: class I SAM-dependent methyltransferase [Actinomycetota bacterium]
MTSEADRQFEFFDRFTPRYDDTRVDFMVDELTGLGDAPRAIDLGCGDGSVLVHLLDRVPGLDAVGVDPSARYVELAEAAGVEAMVGSILDPGLGAVVGGDFDAALVVAVLHHLVGPTRRRSRANVAEAMRVASSLLRPGGKLLIYEPTYRPRLGMDVLFWMKSLVVRLAGNRRVELGRPALNIGAPIVSYYDVEAIERLLGNAGFDLVDTRVVSTGSVAGLARRQSVGFIARRR